MMGFKDLVLAGSRGGTEPVSAYGNAPHTALIELRDTTVPGYLADPMIKAGKLVRILDGYVQTGSALQAVYPHRRHLAGKVRALIDHLVKWFEVHPVN